ncbi:hypothetical protein D9758_003834 [Tetrapyrgos nigripes]|uniref:Uncharacterized protein n=1 Tax=Tetrapyrgos nigripes TaxID=182062 RepID=A0A8H5LRT4_9AGAR|nr:hypothetical protein D9758_003834 [Tetrapyrgos nigripes]
MRLPSGACSSPSLTSISSHPSYSKTLQGARDIAGFQKMWPTLFWRLMLILVSKGSMEAGEEQLVMLSEEVDCSAQSVLRSVEGSISLKAFFIDVSGKFDAGRQGPNSPSLNPTTLTSNLNKRAYISTCTLPVPERVFEWRSTV